MPPVFWAGGRSPFSCKCSGGKSQCRTVGCHLFFLTNTTALHQTLWLGWIAPNSSISHRWFGTSSTNGRGICINCSLKGVSSISFIMYSVEGYSPILLDPMRIHRGIQPGASRWHLPAQGPKSPTCSNPIHPIIYHVFA